MINWHIRQLLGIKVDSDQVPQGRNLRGVGSLPTRWYKRKTCVHGILWVTEDMAILSPNFYPIFSF